MTPLPAPEGAESITEDEIVAHMTAVAEAAKAVPSRWIRGTAEVEAMQLTHASGPQVWEWADSKPTYGTDKFVDGLAVYCPEGRVVARFGDWVVRVQDGTFRVWTDGAFRQSHRPVASAVASGEPSRAESPAPVPANPPAAATGAREALPVAAVLDREGLREIVKTAVAEFARQPGPALRDRITDVLWPLLEHAQAAAAGSHEGVKLWMIDCGEMVAKHRARAEAGEAKLTAIRERAERWAALAPDDDWGESMGDTALADFGRAILAITGTGQEADHGR